MIINPYSTYCEAEILPLYKAVGWSNYYEHPEMLQKAYAGSLCTLAAYEGEKLIGIIRCVGDGYSILFIQDILVYPEHQRKGIGTSLIKAVLEKYPHVYQTELATDNTEKTVSFYKSLGFRPMRDISCCGFMKIRKM